MEEGCFCRFMYTDLIKRRLTNADWWNGWIIKIKKNNSFPNWLNIVPTYDTLFLTRTHTPRRRCLLACFISFFLSSFFMFFFLEIFFFYCKMFVDLTYRNNKINAANEGRKNGRKEGKEFGQMKINKLISNL